jgi:hypothetical protein
MQTVYDFVAPDGRMHYICLLEPESGLFLCLVGHVGTGVKAPPYTRNAMLAFRDPDRIQLEFFWRLPPG